MSKKYILHEEMIVELNKSRDIGELTGFMKEMIDRMINNRVLMFKSDSLSRKEIKSTK